MEFPGRVLPVLAEADVVVAGGGPAGLGAAVAAARSGARVVLLERYGFLGGNFTAASVGTVCGLYVGEDGGWAHVSAGLAKEFTDALAARGAGFGPVPFKETAVFLYVPWAAKRVADQMVHDAGIDLLFHTVVCDVVTSGEHLDAIVVATKRGLQAVVGKAFVDCTGDADVAFLAGVPTETGPSGLRQHASMQFMLQHADADEALAHIGRLSDIIAGQGAHLSRDGGALIPTMRPGEFVGAMTRVRNPDGSPIDTTDPRQATWGELEGRRLAEEAAEFVRAHVPGFAGAFLSDTATQLGVRETRHVEGAYVLTGDDVTGCARFDDAIAAGAWPQEYHVEGRSTHYRFLPEGGYYQVPFRSLLPKGPANLFVAGRCISADHHALASTRVMAPSMAIGQAAGTAAALAVHDDVAPHVVDAGAVRARLLEQGAFLG